LPPPGFLARARFAPVGAAPASSLREFQDPQDAHLPDQRGAVAPQLWQT